MTRRDSHVICDDVSNVVDGLLVLKHTVNLIGTNNTYPSQSPPEWIFRTRCNVNSEEKIAPGGAVDFA